MPAGSSTLTSVRKEMRGVAHGASPDIVDGVVRNTGVTELEDLGYGTTRVHFAETYHVFNPVMRRLLERRVHRFISKDNDHLMKDSIERGVAAMRKHAA